METTTPTTLAQFTREVIRPVVAEVKRELASRFPAQAEALAAQCTASN